jgi:hypothetical protein
MNDVEELVNDAKIKDTVFSFVAHIISYHILALWLGGLIADKNLFAVPFEQWYPEATVVYSAGLAGTMLVWTLFLCLKGARE